MTDVTLTLRGQVVTVRDIEIGGADRSVGIMSDYVEGYTLHDQHGQPLGWEESLTEEEIKAVDAAIWKAIDGPSDQLPPEEDPDGYRAGDISC